MSYAIFTGLAEVFVAHTVKKDKVRFPHTSIFINNVLTVKSRYEYLRLFSSNTYNNTRKVRESILHQINYPLHSKQCKIRELYFRDRYCILAISRVV